MLKTSQSFDNLTSMESQLYYRPEWTCGRYNAEKEVAIYYNLIEGFSYFFEEYSATVIGAILSVRRNGKFTVSDIADKTGIAEECLSDFFVQLDNLKIISSIEPTTDYISEYRKASAAFKCSNAANVIKSTEEKLPMLVSNAEMEYAKKSGGITNVMFELTYNCSEKCIHCYNPGAARNDVEVSHRGDREELTLEEYKRIIDELYAVGLTKVCLTGGDPFSKRIVWDLIDYLYSKEIAFDIFTNGQSIVDKVERIANYYPRMVGVSIYSGNETEHDYITRIKGSWNKSMEVVKQLSALSVPMALKCCIMQPNIKNYYKVAQLAKQYGAAVQYEVSVTDSVDGDRCVSNYLRLTPEQLEIVLRDDNIPLYVGQEAPNFGGQKKIMSENACGAGENSFCITPDGNLIPCCAFHAVFGNLKEKSIKQIISENEGLEWWRNLTLEKYEECGRHDYCDYCNLCAGNNYSEHGTPIKASENNCYLAKVRYNLAMKMMNENYDPLNGKRLEDVLNELPDYKGCVIQRKINRNFSDMSLKVGG